MKIKDLTGMEFGHLLVLNMTDKRTKNGKIIWNCLCRACNKEVEVNGDKLKYGNKTHCGCLGVKNKGFGKPSKLNKYIAYNDYVVGIATNTGNEFYIDIDDYNKIKKYSWYENEDGYLMSRINYKLVRLHRFIMNVKDSKMLVDHINHDTLDNRKINLRIVTRSQNNMNKGLSSNNDSGIAGVRWDENRMKWTAYITINYNRMYLGYFNNFEDAVKARKEAEEKYFGEYSYDNSMKKVT
jgi:hypothetical protein